MNIQKKRPDGPGILFYFCKKENMYKKINSLQNPEVKFWLQLKEKSRVRKKTGQFLLEGKREILLALEGKYKFHKLLYCPSITQEGTLQKLKKNLSDTTDFIELSENVYRKIAYRESSEGMIALVASKDHSLQSLVFKRKNPLLLVAEAPEKPGNIGALLRTADAANIDAVLIVNPKTDLYNPNVIRSSVGCLFTNALATGSSLEISSYLNKKNITTFAAALHKDSVPYHREDYTSACALIVGTESTGLSDFWLENAAQKIIIPMRGKIDSMNVSVAASILIFEALRQRDF